MRWLDAQCHVSDARFLGASQDLNNVINERPECKPRARWETLG